MLRREKKRKWRLASLEEWRGHKRRPRKHTHFEGKSKSSCEDPSEATPRGQETWRAVLGSKGRKGFGSGILDGTASPEVMRGAHSVRAVPCS